MKVFLLTLLFFFLLASIVIGDVEDYNIRIILSPEGKSYIKLLIQFLEPVKKFSFTIFGKAENFYANSTAGEPKCNLKIKEITLIDCDLSLTPEKRILEISFESKDFVKTLDNKNYLMIDLSLRQAIKHFYGVVELPVGMVLSQEKEILPYNGKPTTDGRRIFIIWREENLPAQEILKFQVVYEQVNSSISILQPWQFVLVALFAALIPTYLVIRKRKPEKIIFSVLDEFERKVIDAIISSGGKVNQKKVVQLTGLSKAKVSRVVKSLAQRKLIRIERFGRTNILKLRKKRFWF